MLDELYGELGTSLFSYTSANSRNGIGIKIEQLNAHGFIVGGLVQDITMLHESLKACDFDIFNRNFTINKVPSPVLERIEFEMSFDEAYNLLTILKLKGY